MTARVSQPPAAASLRHAGNALEGSAPSARPATTFGPWYTVFALTLLAVIAGLDRQCLSLLVPLIKADLHLSDTRVSLLVGLSVTLFSAGMAIPAGWIVDRHSRKWFVGIGAALWSCTTMACGLARNFWELFLGRAGTGFTESGLGPAAFSLIRDTLPPDRHGRAFAVYGTALGLSASLAMLVGGGLIAMLGPDGRYALPVVGIMRSWQIVLIVIGAAGLPFALLVLPMAEPARAAAASGAVTYRSALAGMWAHWRVFLPLLLYGAAFNAMSVASVAWMPSVISRSYGLSLADIGLTLALVMGVAPPAGVLASGALLDHLVGRGVVDGAERLGLTVTLLILFPMIAMPLAPGIGTFWLAVIVFFFLAGMTVPVGQVLLARITPPRASGKTSALFSLVFAVLGGALGPAAVGLMSDLLFDGARGLSRAVALWSVLTVIGAAAAMVWLIRELRGFDASRAS